MSLVITYPGGKILDNLTSVTLVNNTAKEILLTVPTGKRWILHWIVMKNPDDVNRGCTIHVYKEAAKTNLLAVLLDETINASAIHTWPRPPHTDSNGILWAGLGYPMPLKEGWTIRFYWAAGGVSAGGTDADGLVCCITEL